MAKMPIDVRKVGNKFYKYHSWYPTKTAAQKALRQLPSGRLYPFGGGYTTYTRHYPFGRARF